MSEASTAPATPPEGTASAQLTAMPLMSHLKELRDRLIKIFIALGITTAISFVFAQHIIKILMVPLGGARLQALGPTETLGNYMKVSLLSGLILAMPIIV